MRYPFVFADLMQRSSASRLLVATVILVALWAAIFWAISLP